MLSDMLLWFALTVIFAFAVGRRLSRKNALLPLPPGPAPLPIIGNVLDMPKQHLAREFWELAKKYGDIVYLNVLGQSIIHLGSYQAVCDLLDQRSANYSDRPKSTMVELVGLDWSFVLMNYGAEWRRHRRAFHSQMNPDFIKHYEGIQTEASRNLLRALLESPQDLTTHIRFTFASTAMRVVYGLELREHDDEYFKIVEKMGVVGQEITVPGRFPVEGIPALRYLPAWCPGGEFKRWAANAQHVMAFGYNHLFDTARAAMDQGKAKDSMVTRFLNSAETPFDGQEEDRSEAMFKGVSASTYVAGADSTNAAIEAFFLAMVLYPEVQKKAQAELDSVVGPTRLPSFSDQESLPYINALVKELLRWHVLSPIGVPHRVVSDDVYKGYLIPAGATVFINAWAISRDPETYPDPERLRPERFIIENRLDVADKDPADYVFGFGRRICPGRHFAEASLFIAFASLLWAFDIQSPIDEAGNPVKVEYKATHNTILSRATVYDYQITPRSPQAAQQIMSHTP